MSNDLITVCTATLGLRSWERLYVLLPELRKFTSIPYRHLLSDDGTLSEEAVKRQRRECEINGVEHYDNPGPYGVSFNLNFLLDKVTTPWCYLVECGLRPSHGWLEAAYAFIEQIHGKQFAGHEVGMVGTSHLQDWCLRLGGAVPTSIPVMDWWTHPPDEVRQQFYQQGWNDGYWSWPRMKDFTEHLCHSSEADEWRGEPANFRNLVRNNQYSFDHYWPKTRRAGFAPYPGAFALINLEAWRKVGKMRQGMTFFEGHLGLRLCLAGYAVLSLQTPPWLHRPSACFSAAAEAKFPRDHAGTNELFLQDFQIDFPKAPSLIDKVIPPDRQRAINDALPEVPLLPGWERWA